MTNLTVDMIATAIYLRLWQLVTLWKARDLFHQLEWLAAYQEANNAFKMAALPFHQICIND